MPPAIQCIFAQLLDERHGKQLFTVVPLGLMESVLLDRQVRGVVACGTRLDYANVNGKCFHAQYVADAASHPSCIQISQAVLSIRSTRPINTTCYNSLGRPAVQY